MLGEILAIGLVGVGVYTAYDKVTTGTFWWEKAPFAQPKAAQLTPAQIAMIQAQAVARARAAEEERQLHQSKYVITAGQKPIQTWQPGEQTWGH